MSVAETIQRSWNINGNVELFQEILNLYRFGTTKPSEYFGDHLRPFTERAENADGSAISARSAVEFVTADFFGDSGPLRFFEPHHIPAIQTLFANDLATTLGVLELTLQLHEERFFLTRTLIWAWLRFAGSR